MYESCEVVGYLHTSNNILPFHTQQDRRHETTTNIKRALKTDVVTKSAVPTLILEDNIIKYHSNYELCTLEMGMERVHAVYDVSKFIPVT